MVGQIKQDLEGTVRSVTGLAEVLKGLQPIVQTLFGTLGQLAETFGSQMSRVQQIAGGGPQGQAIQFATQQGGALGNEFIKLQAERAASNFDPASHPELFAMGPAGRAGKKRLLEPQLIGGELHNWVYEDRAKRTEAFAASIGRQQAPLGGQPPSNAPGGFGSNEATALLAPNLNAAAAGATSLGRDPAGVGFTPADYARVASGAKEYRPGGEGQDAIAKLMSQLQNKSDETSRTLTLQLQRLQESIGKNSSALDEASANYRTVMADSSASTEKRAQAEQQLNAAMGRLSGDVEHLAGIRRYGGGGGGEGEGPEGMTLLQKGRLLAGGGVGAVLGAVGAGAQLYMQAGIAQDRAVQDGALRAAQAQGSAAARGFDITLESHDMTKADNILRYGADYLMPGRTFDYIGRAGRQHNLQVAQQAVRLQQEREKEERVAGQVGAGFSMAAGAALLGGGALMAAGALGALPTGGLSLGAMAAGGTMAGVALSTMIGGADRMVGAAQGGVTGYIGSRATAREGGLESGLTGAFGRFRRGAEWNQLAQDAQRAVFYEDQVGIMDRRRQLEDAELQQMGPQRMALGEILEAVQVRKEGAVQIGKYAGRSSILADLKRQGVVSDEEMTYRAGRDLTLPRTITERSDAELQNRMAINLSGLNEQIQRRQGAGGDVADRYAYGGGLEGYRKFRAAVQAGPQTNTWDAEGGRWESVTDLQRTREADLAREKVWYDKVLRDQQALTARHETTGTGRIPLSSVIGGPGWVSSGYHTASRPHHEGVDYAVPVGTEFRAPFAGTVRYNDNAAGGAEIILDEVGGAHRSISLSHASARSAANGSMARAGTLLGLTGGARGAPGAGDSEGPHAHIGMTVGGQRVDPSEYINFGLSSSAAPAESLTSKVRESRINSRAAELELSPSEFMRQQFQLSNVIGNRGGEGLAGVSETERVIRMGRAGFGSFDQQLQNIGGLNQARGGQDNTKTLELVLTQAVAAGFDKSRTAQMFTAQTTHLMDTLNLRSAETTAIGLRTGAGLLGSTFGTADERSLREAGQGLAAYGQYTGQAGGIMGAMKMMGAAREGALVGTGGGIIARMSAPEMQDALVQMRRKAETGIDFLSPNVRALVSQEERANPGQGMESAEKAIRGSMGAMRNVFVAEAKLYGRMDVDKQMAAIRGATGADRQKLEEQFIGAMRETGAVGQQGMQAMTGFAVQELAANAGGTASQRRALEAKYREQIEQGNAVYVDPANVSRRRYLDSVLSNFSASTDKVSRGAYLDYIKTAGSPAIKIDSDIVDKYAHGNKELAQQMSRGMTAASVSNAQQGSPLFQAQEAQFARLNKLDLLRQSEMAAETAGGGVQQVHIVNFYDIVQPIRAANAQARPPEGSGKRNPNGR